MASETGHQRHVLTPPPNEHSWRGFAGSIARLATREGTLAGVLIAAAVAIRVALTLQGWPTLNSDEALFGITALHIARDGAHPLYAYGEWYLGGIEAYLAAPLFRLFGVSLLMLRLGLIGMFALFLASMYGLTTMLYSRGAALIALIVLGAGPVGVVDQELRASGGYPETLLFGSLLFVLATWLALTAGEDRRAAGRWRALAFGGWGLAAGLGVWSDPLILPQVLMAGLLLMLFCWREMLGWRGALWLVGCGIGILPALLYNLTAPAGRSTFDAVGRIQSAGGAGAGVSLPSRLLGTLVVSLPNMTGANALCQLPSSDVWPLPARASASVLGCTVLRTAWGMGFLMLGAVAVALCCRRLWRLWQGATAAEPAAAQRPAMVRHAGRLAVLAGAGLSLALYARSPASGLNPWSNARYLFPLLLAFPVALGPLWEAAAGSVRAERWGWRVLRLSCAVGLGCVCLVFVGGIVQAFQAVGREVPVAQLHQRKLADDLLRIGATRIYAEYWTCYALVFISQEHIMCGRVDEHLAPGRDRVPTYRALVHAAPDPAYVFPLGSPEAEEMAHETAPPGMAYERQVMDGYVIYRLVPR